MRRGVLRMAVLGLGAALAGGGLWLIVAGCPLGFGLRLAIPGLVLIGAVIGERWRYRRVHAARPGPEWVATGERFVDPESGKLVTVFYRPSTGERRYVGSGS
jgi:hypothetical protein